jgi:tetratricopeptide (TPR) repeat protein
LHKYFEARVMSPHIHRRQEILFLLAILLPCAVIVALGWLLMSRERELSEKRRAEEERSRLGHFSQELLVRIERIKLQQMTAIAGRSYAPHHEQYADPAMALAAPIGGNRLILPWEGDPALEEARRLLGDPVFARRIDECERQELREQNLQKAVSSYRGLLQSTREPVPAAYARLLLGRALGAARRADEARHSYEALLALPSGMIDDQGIPQALCRRTTHAVDKRA